MSKVMLGVNLGGWLVVERWMTPSLFAGTNVVDEYGFMKTPGAATKIKRHRDTFVTEEDWQWLARAGVSLVRLPVGYWALGAEDGFLGACEYIDWAFAMAEKYSIGILLDFHALKGSQNGEAHSGVVGAVNWWKYRHESLSTLVELAGRYSKSPALWGVEVMNEPKLRGGYFRMLWFYRKAYAALRAVLRPGVYTVFHDAFVPPLFAGALWPRRGYPVVMDSHFYLIAGRALGRLSPRRYDAMRRWVYGAAMAFSRLFQPVVIGEWSAVLPQAMFNRADEALHKDMLRETIKRQRKVYSGALATMYWSYKTEGRGMYHFRSLVEDGVFAIEK